MEPSTLVQFLTLCFICCMWAGLTAASVPKRVRIGGFFSPLTRTGSMFFSEAEHLAAFVMAANDINNKTDGIFDKLLLGTDFHIALGLEDSLASAAANAVSLGTAFGGKGVTAAVSSLGDVEALIVAQVLDSMNVLAVMSVASSALFDMQSDYPAVANIRPLISREGMVIQNVLCQSSARKIVVFTGTDDENEQMVNQFEDETRCELDVLAVITIRADLFDMAESIAEAKEFGARYYVNFLSSIQHAALLEQGYAAGLFHDNTVVYTSTVGAMNISQYFSPETDVARVLTGFFYFDYIPDFYMGKTEESVTFARRWAQQPSRVGKVVNGELVCDNTTDSDGNYLYQAVFNETTVCTGLDFSLYDEFGSSLHPQAALTYDSTIYLAMAIDKAITAGLDFTDSKTLLDLMVHNISFTGTTGPMSLFEGYPKYGYNGRGVRNAGIHYSTYNFNPSRYLNGSTDYMVQVGTFDGDSRVYTPCSGDDDVVCFLPVYSAPTDGSYNIPPSDAPPVIVLDIPVAFSSLCYALAGIISLLVFGFSLFTYVHRRSKVIKAAQPTLLWCILIGGLLATLRILFGGLSSSDFVCSGEVWFGHLAFIIMVGSLFVKSYRVHCIVNTRQLVRVTFSAMHAFRILLGFVFGTVIILIPTQLVGRPHVRSMQVVVANQETDTLSCGMQYPEFQTALFVLEGLLLAISFRICWEIRKVPDIVNESKLISTAMASILMVSVLIMPIVYFLGLSNFTQELVASFGFGFGAIVTLVLLFVPKILVVYHLTSARMSAKVAALESMLSSKKKNQLAAVTAVGYEHDAEALLKGKSKQEKLLICQEQYRRWQMLLMAQQRAALNSNPTSKSGNSSGGVASQGQGRLNASLLASVVEAEPDFNNFQEDNMFAMDPASSLNVPSLTGSTLTGQGGPMSLYGSNNGCDDLVMQEV
jgi:hypothetical protein